MVVRLHNLLGEGKRITSFICSKIMMQAEGVWGKRRKISGSREMKLLFVEGVFHFGRVPPCTITGSEMPSHFHDLEYVVGITNGYDMLTRTGFLLAKHVLPLESGFSMRKRLQSMAPTPMERSHFSQKSGIFCSFFFI
jgi:hypothetical protein